MKYLAERFSLHNVIIGSVVIGGISFAVSSISLDFWYLAISMFIGASCCCIINVTCNVCVLKLYASERQDYWVQLLHTIFGVGGFIGPFAVAIFGAKTYLFLGILLALTFPLFLILSSPENRESARIT